MITTIARRPRSIVIAAVLQLLTAVPLILGSLVVHFHGADAQAAAEAEAARQGVPASVLAEHGVNFAGDETLAIALITALAVLAVLNLAGRRLGQILSWIVQPIVLVLGIVIIPAQLFTAQILESTFASSSDPMLARIDVPALVNAAAQAMPGWLPANNIAKLTLTTVGSILVVILLAIPSARAYFRRT